MKSSQSVVDVALIIRDFLQNEGRTLAISKGKMLRDDTAEAQDREFLKVS